MVAQRALTPFSVKESAAPCPWCLQKAFTGGEPGPWQQYQVPLQEPGEATGASVARTQAFLGASLRALVPSLT